MKLNKIAKSPKLSVITINLNVLNISIDIFKKISFLIKK